MAEIITRKYKNGELVEESKEQVDWQPNEADLDLIEVGCECGNKFEMPWDAVAMCGFDGMHCGQCGETGKMSVVDQREHESMEISPELEAKLDKAIKDAKATTDELEEARKVPDELLHKRFDI